MSKKLTKEEVRGPDAFIQVTDKIVEYIEKHAKLVGSLLLGILFIGVGKVSYDYVNKKNELKAQAELYTIEKKQRDIKKSLLTKKQDKKDIESDYGSVLNLYKSFISENAKLSAAFMAALDGAAIYTDYKKFDKALEILKMVENNIPKDSFFFGLVFSKIGSVYTYIGKWDQAIEAYSRIVKEKAQAHLHADSLLKVGMIYQKQNKNEKAEEYYRKVDTQFFSSDAGQAARSYLRLLELKKRKN